MVFIFIFISVSFGFAQLCFLFPVSCPFVQIALLTSLCRLSDRSSSHAQWASRTVRASSLDAAVCVVCRAVCVVSEMRIGCYAYCYTAPLLCRYYTCGSFLCHRPITAILYCCNTEFGSFFLLLLLSICLQASRVLVLVCMCVLDV